MQLAAGRSVMVQDGTVEARVIVSTNLCVSLALLLVIRTEGGFLLEGGGSWVGHSHREAGLS